MKLARHVNSALYCLLLTLSAAVASAEQPSPAAVAAFDSYIRTLELRLASQHTSQDAFLYPSTSNLATASSLRKGVPVIEHLSPPLSPRDAMLHHWRGTAFIPSARATEFERLLKNFSGYPKVYAPQVLQASVLSQQSDHRDIDHLNASMRVHQKHVITVVMDTSYSVNFVHLDAQHGYSVARSTKISEIASPGTPTEHALTDADDHGFLWRLNTYWSYEDIDGGLLIQIESVSLTRAIPHGLAWAVQPYVESVPRESLEFTLQATQNALRK